VFKYQASESPGVRTPGLFHYVRGMSYNPGGWNDDKLKVYGLITVVVLVVVGVLAWLGVIDLGPPPELPK
jgi:hypothetical protein